MASCASRLPENLSCFENPSVIVCSIRTIGIGSPFASDDFVCIRYGRLDKDAAVASLPKPFAYLIPDFSGLGHVVCPHNQGFDFRAVHVQEFCLRIKPEVPHEVFHDT